VDVPSGQLQFAKADTAQTPRKGSAFDHIGIDMNPPSFEAEGIKLDEPYWKDETTRVAFTSSRIGGAPNRTGATERLSRRDFRGVFD
jgi:hypothetical protein